MQRFFFKSGGYKTLAKLELETLVWFQALEPDFIIHFNFILLLDCIFFLYWLALGFKKFGNYLTFLVTFAQLSFLNKFGNFDFAGFILLFLFLLFKALFSKYDITIVFFSSKEAKIWLGFKIRCYFCRQVTASLRG